MRVPLLETHITKNRQATGKVHFFVILFSISLPKLLERRLISLLSRQRPNSYAQIGLSSFSLRTRARMSGNPGATWMPTWYVPKILCSASAPVPHPVHVLTISTIACHPEKKYRSMVEYDCAICPVWSLTPHCGTIPREIMRHSSPVPPRRAVALLRNIEPTLVMIRWRPTVG